MNINPNVTADDLLAAIRARVEAGIRARQPKQPKRRPRVGAVIIFKEDVDPARAQELINMMTVRLVEPTEVVEYDAARGTPVWYIP